MRTARDLTGAEFQSLEDLYVSTLRCGLIPEHEGGWIDLGYATDTRRRWRYSNPKLLLGKQSKVALAPFIVRYVAEASTRHAPACGTLYTLAAIKARRYRTGVRPGQRSASSVAGRGCPLCRRELYP